MLGRRGYCRYRFTPPPVEEKWIRAMDPTGTSELLELLEQEEVQQRAETAALLELLHRQRGDIAILRRQQQQLQEELESVQLNLNEQRQQNQQLRRQLMTIRKLRCTEKQKVLKKLAAAESAFEQELQSIFLPSGSAEGPSGATRTFFDPPLTQQQKEGAAQKLFLRQQQQQQPMSEQLGNRATSPPSGIPGSNFRGGAVGSAVSGSPPASPLLARGLLPGSSPTTVAAPAVGRAAFLKVPAAGHHAGGGTHTTQPTAVLPPPPSSRSPLSTTRGGTPATALTTKVQPSPLLTVTPVLPTAINGKPAVGSPLLGTARGSVSRPQGLTTPALRSS
ncbi:hypothetical protein cyc_00044 [Cyclospora cayetanensis]|uniref:Uncharacterized protein n=1 Tax=Cyclospora cayetanensis TaxID=88456 RepID=A0A1D3CVH5_9EIME|nr:hypothetical protein cyc_00044 [Cyclospora cayetanensis]